MDDSKTILTMIRSMISALKVARVRSFDRGDLALHAILQEPPNVILTDLAMSPMSGMQLIKLIRQQTMEPLCFIPVIVITAHATQARVAQLFEIGAHHVLAKPLSSAVLQNRLRALSSDRRVMRLDGDRYVIDGMHEVLLEKQSRLKSLEKAREFHEQVLPQAKESQREADEILRGLDVCEEEPIRARPFASSGMRIAEHLREAKVREDKSKSASRPSSKRYAGVSRRGNR
ncbi:PleD family two-component system response regulator [Cohaesibacter sp. ES.047]|uniref:response regulator n=1 Tax=Cohaesibacter sp. ES.047 TaxID=1798205 RepID=UPI0012FD10F0|nr:response regulator [Cohaesibacter sp. ES.047]